ncbi:toll/interleukin-1 receptor domain-containing protein [Variovorax sp. J2P1-59]|uniref:toll/interleukin-1 receptor domain-containing protein n=1 Tax=Variovorax flavidus TaxID=3053501 RepID=UPI002574BBCB|nr:toll/interleukin-1 receptor domain-containing protein [Variovorax sp. J2P1-59]MDM0076909.1 toll/interleukin-1 receptor domain-containing protein [Variovorax sp. J2P1-59]
MDVLRIYIVFNPDHDVTPLWCEALSKAFDGIGMQREGLRFSVPVHRRSATWDGPQDGLLDANPRCIDFGRAEWNVVVVLQDVDMMDHRERWGPYLANVMSRYAGNEAASTVIPIAFGDAGAAHFRELHEMPKHVLSGAPNEEGTRQLFVSLLNAILVMLDPEGNRHAAGAGHAVFISHAKRDGLDAAEKIARQLRDVMESLGPQCFFDKASLIPGDEYPKRFEESIGRASLLALVTDTYHARPWCRWEMLCAKELGRPVVVADLSRGRIERSFPYIGNVPTIRLNDAPESLSNESVEVLIQALLSESLRIQLWRRLAGRIAQEDDSLLTRPPELSDLALIAASLPGRSRRVLYPDPPLSTEEIQLLSRAFPFIDLRTLSQAIA